MIQVSIARRYARALFEAAGDAYERAGDEIAAAASALGGEELAPVFENPATPRAARQQVVEAVITAGQLSPVVGNTLRLLNDRNRIPYLAAIARDYAALVDAKSGRIRAKVTSATPLPADTADKLRAALGQATNRAVSVETAVDKSLLGGVVAQVGSVQYDGSLRTQLEKLRRELSERA